jgi:hypothetical protein
LHTAESRPEIPATVYKVVLKKDGEDQLDRSFEERSVTECQEGQKYPKYNKTEERLTGLVTACVGITF